MTRGLMNAPIFRRSLSLMASTKKIASGEEKASPVNNPWPPAPLPNDAELPEGTGHGHSPEVPWPQAENGKRPFKNLR